MRPIFYLVVCAASLLSPVQGEGEGGAQVDGNSFSFENQERKEVILVEADADQRLNYRINNEDGSYQYGYQSGRRGDTGGYNFRHEYKQSDGVVYGQHGFALPDGTDQTVNYVADANGYRVLGDGQRYSPVSQQEKHRRRGILDDAERAEEEPLELDLELLQTIEDPAEVRLEADPDVVLSAGDPQPPHVQLDPDTGAFKFGFRSSSGGNVLYRHEERDDDGVVSGQYGHRAAGGAPVLVSYVSDAFGYRVVDPAAAVPVVSRRQAEEQLGQLTEGSGYTLEQTEKAELLPDQEEEVSQEADATPLEAAEMSAREEVMLEAMAPTFEEPRPVVAPELSAEGGELLAENEVSAVGDAEGPAGQRKLGAPVEEQVALRSATGGASDNVVIATDPVRPFFRPLQPQYSVVLPYATFAQFVPAPYAAVRSPYYPYQAQPYVLPGLVPYHVYRYPEKKRENVP